jgi:glutamine amidotransferase
MCQLLGLSSNKDVDLKFSLREFQIRGRLNPHGFGFSFYKEGQSNAILIKKPYPLYKENLNQDIFEFKSKTIIGHVRYASCGELSHANTHPFINGRWSFAHNGTVREIKNWQLNTLHPDGNTDSEHAFYYLLEKIENISDLHQMVDILERESIKIKSYGKFNYLFSNGKYLFAYGDNSLYFVIRQSPFSDITLRDAQYTLDLNEIKAPDENAVLIATDPLTRNEQWKQLHGLTVFKDGKMVKV